MPGTDVPGDDVRCPVCREPATAGQPACTRCGWTLNTGWRLAGPDPVQLSDRALATARHRFALIGVLQPVGLPLPPDLAAWRLVEAAPVDQSLAVVGTRYGAVHVVGLDGSLTVHRLHNGPISAVDAAPDGTVAVGGWDGSVVAWVPGLGPSVAAAHGGRVNAVCCTGKGVASVGDDGLLRLTHRDGTTGHLVPLPPIRVGQGGAAVLAVHGRSVVAAGGDGRLRIVDLGLGRIDDERPTEAGVSCLAADSGGRFLVAGHIDGSVSLIALSRGADRSWPAATAIVSAVAVGSDGTVVTGDRAGQVRRWAAVGSSPSGGLPVGQHRDAVTAVTSGGDGPVLSIGRGDGAVRVWPAIWKGEP